jgi:hypothetical protein
MRKWHLIIVMTIAFLLQDCTKSCSDASYYLYGATGNDLKKYAFLPGSYWIYADSASGAIDSETVLSYSSQNYVVVGNTLPQNGSNCPIYADVSDVRVRSYLNGTFSSYFAYHGQGTIVETKDSAGFPALFNYSYFINGLYGQTLNNYTVLSKTYPRVYENTDTIQGPPVQYVDVYYTDYIGIVKRVERNSMTGVITWKLLRYHLINP